MKRYCLSALTGMLLLIGQRTLAQNQDTSLLKLQQLPSGYISSANDKINNLSNLVTRQSEELLKKEQANEASINARLSKIDSVLAHNLFTNSLTMYQNLQNRIQSKIARIIYGIPGGGYIAYLDTLKTSLSFLGQYNTKLPQLKNAFRQVQGTLLNINLLENKLQGAQDIQQFLQQRKALLVQALSPYGNTFSKDLGGLNAQLYYYTVRITEYKETISDPGKAEMKGIEFLRNIKTFNTFMQKNSMLAGLFGLPSDYGTRGTAGLQTLAVVQQMIQSKIASGGPNATQLVNLQLQGAMSRLEILKNKFPGLNSTAQIPDFQPSPLKTKTLLKRLQYGYNLGFQRGSSWYPATAIIALQAGYEFSQNGSAGVGIGYILGMGSSINNINFSNQGIEFRTFAEYKIKGSFYFNGAVEQSYNGGFKNFHMLLNNVNPWTTGALAGISKKFNISNPFSNGLGASKWQGTITLMYDFLHEQHIPQTPGFVFRTGYEF